MEVIPSRELNSLYILLDFLFLLALCGLLLWKKRRLTVLFGLFGGVLYFLVDYGIFYKLLGTRQVTGAPVGPFLFWLSMSYGFTNFVWIWLWLQRDVFLKEWSILIVTGWFSTALLSQNFGTGFSQISISRGTGSYHGVMAAILFVGYGLICVLNMGRKAGKPPLPVFWMLAIGILVQFSWEAVLLLTGIRAAGLGPLIVDSLLETNLGIPYIWFIERAVLHRWNEDLSPADGRQQLL